MLVRDAMSKDTVSAEPSQTIREAATLMMQRRVGAVVVTDPALPGPGILTERDIMRAVAEGADPETTTVEACMTFEARTANAGWGLDEAAAEMTDGHFRHLLVVDDEGRMVGIVSMRDIVHAHVGHHRERAGGGGAASPAMSGVDGRP
ncbi:MAG: CBS domain-containing protein [Candidatus Dormibacteria bacterium]